MDQIFVMTPSSGVNLTDKLPKFVKKLFLWKIAIKMRQLYELGGGGVKSTKH